MITAQRVLKAAGKHVTRTALTVRAKLGAQANRHCPACGGAVVGFFRYGDNSEWGCPLCGASPRERLVNYLISRGGLVVPQGGAILHMAPNEGSLVEKFRSKAGEYVPADIDPSRYPVPGVRRVDLMNIGERDHFDLFYASHVMEHVPDAAHVLRQIYDALKPGAEAWLLVPLWDKPTEEGAPGMTPQEREKRYGQWDHVRQYGLDFADHIRAAGFEVELLRAEDCPPGDVSLMALDDVIFCARKPASVR
ncbi:MAG: methyltransferase domain-containing protein [Sphingobium sp.]|nr:methyltransferase domain-containing protein [Sphingobium sp.]